MKKINNISKTVICPALLLSEISVLKAWIALKHLTNNIEGIKKRLHRVHSGRIKQLKAGASISFNLNGQGKYIMKAGSLDDMAKRFEAMGAKHLSGEQPKKTYV